MDINTNASMQMPPFVANVIPSRLEFLFQKDQDILEGHEIKDVETLLKNMSLGKGIQCVFAPQKAIKKRRLLLTQPDYWYPAFIVLLYGWSVGTAVWSCIVWLFGSSIVFFLQRVLNGDNSFATTLSITGYCILPLVMMSLTLVFFKDGFLDWFFIRFIWKAICLAWSSYGGSTVLLSCHELKKRKLLVLYPLVLFNLYVISLCRHSV